MLPQDILGSSLNSQTFKDFLSLLPSANIDPQGERDPQKEEEETVGKGPRGDRTLTLTDLERREYKDVVYLNLRPLGISFQFQRSLHSDEGHDHQDDDDQLFLMAVDIYNHEQQPHLSSSSSSSSPPHKARTRRKPAWGAYPSYPVTIHFASQPGSTTTTTAHFNLQPGTTGQELVDVLGEPCRKGGGQDLPGGLGPNAWIEWKLNLPSPPKVHTEPSPSSSSSSSSSFKVFVELAGSLARGPGRWELDRSGSAIWKVLTLSLPE
ncbi:hypothetical protein IE53DRAFT_391187 [Violaceomyces palustris]|uniref:Uncharacterized protein n=1 Tax=Violaceomyces palustris TaxID=1673888 RepID=A0ACD0NLF6_9BASI|nr:hypothetical protein IE53DRAFT_391187 [Violaceomyces palustris]